MRFQSIRVRLTASVAILLVIFITVAASAVFSLVRIDRRIDAFDGKWLAGTQLLGDLKNAISEFRVAESYRFLAVDQPGVIQAEFLAERQVTLVDELMGRFRAIAKDVDMVDDFDSFEVKWRELVLNHHRWIDEAAGERMVKPMGFGSSLQKRYEAVQVATNNLIDDARTAANAEAAAASSEATRVTLLVVGLSAVATILAFGLIGHIDLHVARPLGTITSALARLAAGDRLIRVPELHRRDEIGAMAAAFEVFRRNAVALGEAQERAEALARHDALTGLANRRLFSTRLAAALDTAQGGASTALMLIDLDRFKPVNDLHGHAVGDMVLCEVAARLRGLTEPDTLVARLGGDEFAVILPAVATRLDAMDQAITLAARIVERLADTMQIEGMDLALGASLGIAMMPGDGSTAETMLRAADLALYRAKHEGRGTFRFFETGMDAEVRGKSELELDLRGALTAGTIQPFYQPVVHLASGRIAGFEVLARWHHPQRGFVPPDTFIPLVQQCGALTRMTTALLRQAVEDARHWPPETTLAINVSPRQLQDLAFPTAIAGVLMSTGFPPQRLEIEVTETALLDDVETARLSLGALRDFGIRIVLDDFGTGYSSLSHLRQLKFDKIKIDRSFVGSMTHNPDSAAIVEAVLGLARTLGVAVVAEGIETTEAAEWLLDRTCTFGQGYLFSPAVPAAKVAVTRAWPLRGAA